MRIIVFSDTHHYIDDCIHIVESIIPCGVDMILHAGDCNEDGLDLQSIFPDIPVKYVQGNNNMSRTVPYEMMIDAQGVKIFLTHGHMYGVKYDSSYAKLAKAASEQGADIAVFGHTHMPYCAAEHGLRLLNPGSIKYGGTYGVIEIDEGKISMDVINYR